MLFYQVHLWKKCDNETGRKCHPSYIDGQSESQPTLQTADNKLARSPSSPPRSYKQEGIIAVFTLNLFLLHPCLHLYAWFRRAVSHGALVEVRTTFGGYFSNHLGPGNRTFTHWVIAPASDLYSKESFLDRRRLYVEKHKMYCIKCFLTPKLFARTLQIVQSKLEHVIRKGKIQDCPGTQGQEGDKGRSSLWHCSRVLSFLKHRLEDEHWCFHKKQTNRKEKNLNVLNKFATSSWPGFLPIFGFMHLAVKHICKVSQGWGCSEFVFTVISPFPCHPLCVGGWAPCVPGCGPSPSSGVRRDRIATGLDLDLSKSRLSRVQLHHLILTQAFTD